jgi:hypothetical protein
VNVNVWLPKFDNLTKPLDEEGDPPPTNTPPNETADALTTRYPCDATAVPETLMTVSCMYPAGAVAYRFRAAPTDPGANGADVEFS